MKKTTLTRVKAIIESQNLTDMANTESPESKATKFAMLDLGKRGEKSIKVNVIYFK